MKTDDLLNFLEAKGNIFPSEKEKQRVKNSFIEFAKFHVKEALKMASKVEYRMGETLNAYPENNII